tara:strand:- start:2102 stop:3745 length:1644 start_codon:yes stop_codon:yes gene_type:complete
MNIFLKKKIAFFLRILKLIKIFYIVLDFIRSFTDKKYKEFSMKVDKLKNFSKRGENTINRGRNIFIMGFSEYNTILLQTTQIISINQLGYRIIVILSSPNQVIEKMYRKLGVSSFIYYYEFLNRELHKSLFKIFKKNITQDHFLELKYKDVEVGKISTSTLMRKNLVSRFDIDGTDFYLVTEALSQSMFFSDFAEEIIKKYKPVMVCFMDRGYSPEGEIFNFAILNKIPTTELHVGHKSGLLLFKKYFSSNRNMHYASLSKKTWNRVSGLNLGEKKKFVLNELESCYQEGSWYDEVGTQFNKKDFSKQELYEKYNLNPKLKTVVVFSHIFWDATFFFGKDIFFDYQEWLIQTIKKLSFNKNINCLIKLHPAHAVKNNRNSKVGSFEKQIILEELKVLPNHIKIIDYKDRITTLSLLKHIDYCITVRGTVGIESACLGVPVLLAGTGRYDHLGFTIDHNNKKEYFNSLLNIHKIKKYDKRKINLAIKYAYSLLFERNIETKILNFKYRQDSSASLMVRIEDESDDIYDRNEIKKLMYWLQNKDEDFLN